MNKVPFYGAAVLCLDDPPVQDILPRVERRVRHLRPLAAGARLALATSSSVPTGSTLHRDARRRAARARSRSPCPAPTTCANSLAAVAVGPRPRRALRGDPRRPRVVHRRRPPLPGARRGGRRPRDRRLRPPPDRDPAHARGAAPARRRRGARWCSSSRTATRAPRRCGTSSAGLPPGRRAAADRHLPGLGGADPRDHARRRSRGAIAERGHRQVAWAGDLKAATERLAAEVREGDVVLTLGAGSVWTAGEELLRRQTRMTRRGLGLGGGPGLPVGPPPDELLDLPLDPAVEESPFLRPRRRTRVRPRRRGFTAARPPRRCRWRAVGLLAVVGAWTAWQRVFASDRLRGGPARGARQPLPLRGRGARADRARGGREHPRPRHRRAQGAPAGLALGRGRDRDAHAARHRARRDPRAGAARPRRARPPLPDGRDGGLIDIYGPRTGAFDLPIVRGLARRRGGVAARPGAAGGRAARRPRRARAARSPRCTSCPPATCASCCAARARCSSSATRRTAQRLVTFLGLRQELAERAPDAEHFDLRFRGRIFAKQPVRDRRAEPRLRPAAEPGRSGRRRRVAAVAPPPARARHGEPRSAAPSRRRRPRPRPSAVAGHPLGEQDPGQEEGPLHRRPGRRHAQDLRDRGRDHGRGPPRRDRHRPGRVAGACARASSSTSRPPSTRSSACSRRPS